MKVFFSYGFSLLFCCTLIARSSFGQKASVDIPPDYVVYLAPLASGGFSFGDITVAQRTSIHSAFSYNAGFIAAIVDNEFIQTFRLAPTLGLLYDSRSIKYTRASELQHTVTINSVNVLAGIAFPLVQLHFGMNIPIVGSHAQEISTDKLLVTTIHPRDLKITFEPRIVLYFPVFIGSYDRFIVPFCSFGYQLTKTDLPTFGISGLRISTIELGLSYPLKIYEHYSAYGL